MFAGRDRRWTWRPCCRVEFAHSQTWRHRKPWATICACYLHYHLPFSPSLSPHTFLPAACWTAEVSKLSKAKRRRRMVGGREGGREEDGVLGGLWVTGQGLVPTSITTPFGNGHTDASMNQKLQFSCQLVDFKAQLQTSTSDFNHFTQKLRFFQCRPKLWVVARGLKFLGFQFLFIIILFHS